MRHIRRDYYVLTEAGKRLIPQLILDKRDDEVAILDYLSRNREATVAEIALATRQDEGTVHARIQVYCEERLVRRQAGLARFL